MGIQFKKVKMILNDEKGMDKMAFNHSEKLINQIYDVSFKADVLVIGGGPAGAWAALSAKKTGQRLSWWIKVIAAQAGRRLLQAMEYGIYRLIKRKEKKR